MCIIPHMKYETHIIRKLKVTCGCITTSLAVNRVYYADK